jgi:hypothetical protein
MADQATYLLRSTSEGVAYYLSNVSPNGCHVEFDRRIDHGWRFTAAERDKLASDHDHIRGRWVLLEREKKRVAATPTAHSGTAGTPDTEGTSK